MHQLDKLNHLKNIIKQVPHERFDLDKWRTDSKTENVTFAQLLLSDADCCVMGWATADATFRRLNFMLFDGVPLYAPFRANTGEPFTYEELKTNVVYRGSEAVREFFGLNYEDVDHIIFESNYAFEDPIKDEIIHHINHVIDRVNIRPQDLDHLLSSSIVALDKEVREFTLNDDEVREISVVVDCFNKFFPDGAYLEFIATVNVPGDCDPLEYIASNYNIKEPLAFVPKPNEALEEYLETYPIEHLMHNWQEDFISPYDEIINQRLTHIALQNLNNAKAVQ